MNIKKIIIGFVVVFFFLAIFSVPYFLLFTAKGGEFVVKKVITKYVPAGAYTARKVGGDLFHQLTFEDIEVKDLEYLPTGYALRIQKADIYFTAFNAKSLNIEIHNARLILPGSGPLVFEGIYQDGALDFEIFFAHVEAEELFLLFPQIKELKDIRGSIDGFEAVVKGKLWEPDFSGKLVVNSLQFKNFSLTNCPVDFALSLENILDNPKVYGDVKIAKGVVLLKNSSIKLEPGKISFSGGVKTPVFGLLGSSTVENTKIDISFKGTIQEPVLKLDSDVFAPQEKLMIMLLTGKSWSGTEASLFGGGVSADLIKDFADYFLLGGSGSKLAAQFGISDITLQCDAQKKGIGFKKDVTDKIGVSYGITQEQAQKNMNVTITQDVGVAYKVSDELSIEGSKEIQPQQQATGNETQASLPNDTLFLKYKKKF